MKKKGKKKILSQILNGHRQLPGNNFISNLNSEKKLISIFYLYNFLKTTFSFSIRTVQNLKVINLFFIYPYIEIITTSIKRSLL